MQIDESIIQLGEKLDAWFVGNVATFASADRVAQGKALLHGFELIKEFDHLKADGLAAIRSLLDRRDLAAEDQRAASLLRGFEFAVRLADTLHDEFLDTDGENEIWRLMDAIVRELSTIGPGRAAMADLLDHRDAGVRVSTGAYLIDLMPDRVVPILREVSEKKDGSSAGLRTLWILLAWEREGKSRFNYSSGGKAGRVV